MDKLTPEDIDRILEQIGVLDIADSHQYVGTHPVDPSVLESRSGLFVRGARNGGSPMFNFVTRGVALIFLGLLIFIGVGIVGWWRGRGDPPEGGSYASTPSNAISCKPRWWYRRGDVADLFMDAPAIAAGTVQLPRDIATLSQLGAQSHDLNGDRVDVFTVDGGKIAVRYIASTPEPRSVSIGFDNSIAFCRALWLTGLLGAKAVFYVDPKGFIHLVEGSPGEFWVTGLVQAKGVSEGISALQLQLRRP